ncbi:MAG: DMT family transporter [Pseudomonadales bacterium]|jgi:drug/metabolite transporter (DMT)-like permease|tara:strand:+ start:1495 stop:2403 length:909 start_codon:yes stop_codon:yes gene_type:complete
MGKSHNAYVYGLLTVLCWSTVATAFKFSLAHIDIYQLLFFATLTSAVVLSAPIIWRKEVGGLWSTLRAHWRISLSMAVLNPCIYYLVLFGAYDRLPAQIAQPVNYTWAIVLTLFSALILKQKPLLTDYLAAFICYGGVVIIVTGGHFEGLANVSSLGLLLAIVSTVIWAGYWIMNIRDSRDQRYAMCLNFLVALPITAVLCGVFSSFEPGWVGLAGSLWVGVFEMGLAFLLWSKALRLAENSSRVSNLIFIAPFLSLVFIHFILGEAIVKATYIGLTVIVSGLLCQQLGANKRLAKMPRDGA